MRVLQRIWVLALLMAAMSAPALALPQVSSVLADDAALVSGQDGWYVQFEASEGGTLALALLSGETGEKLADLGAVPVEAGQGRVGWDGRLPNGSAVPAGSYMLALRVKNYWGEESEERLISLQIYDSEDQMLANRLDLDALIAEEAAVWEEAFFEEEPVAQADDDAVEMLDADLYDENGVPIATSFWDMDPDLYDLSNPAHQQAIWDLMMLPITVFDVDQTAHVYPTNQPGIKKTPYEQNCTGELHGQSQGVRVLEADNDGDGYVLIEAYSNDGTKTENTYMESLNAKRIQGYVKESLLFQVTPSDKYALLVDKLRQRLYLFEDGRIISELLVSTGLNNESQPYNETPAGEFITTSRMGAFEAGKHTVGRYAIRINGGTLLHEVLHDKNADGTRNYSAYEPLLGQKASHGCIRIQRRENENGHNMAWFWSNLELKTKVFIWDDQGREMYKPDLPDPALPLYRNANGGSNYHIDQNCSGVKARYLPLTGDFTYGDLGESGFKKLTPCPYCGAPDRLEDIYTDYVAAAEQIGAEIPADVLAMFGLE